MASNPDVLVLGGGFAGLSCAVDLAAAGARVTVVEKKPHLGGRAYSFADPETKESIDNGQHLFMGCYRATRRFLAQIGAESRLKFLPRISVDFVDASGARDALSCPAFLGAPLHLAAGVLGLRGLTFRDKAGLLRLDRCLRQFKRGGIPASIDALTVRQWLDSLGQSRRIQERLFDPIALAALNDDPQVTAATGFAQVLMGMFFQDAESSRLGLSSVGLSDLYTGFAHEFIEARAGRVLLSSRAASFIEEGGRVAGVVLENGERLKASAVVSTLPPWDLRRLPLPQELHGPWENFKPSPIVSLTFWLDRPLLKNEPLIGLLGTEIQWAFNKSALHGEKGPGQTLALVISGAHRHVGLDPKALREIAERDLARCFPEFSKVKILRWKVVKEPFATLSPVPGSEALRPLPGSGMPGFHFAGDWTRTGLPATIESAVVSGQAAAEVILGCGHKM